MTSYRCGDVILVNIPFSGAAGFKKRPAVVISTVEFNNAGTKLIVAAIRRLAARGAGQRAHFRF